jgi:hypothetical protein
LLIDLVLERERGRERREMEIRERCERDENDTGEM